MEAAIIFHNAKIPTNLRTCDQQPHSLVRNSMWLFRTYRAPLELRSRQRGGSPHYYGEAHAEVYISRWFESVCSPPKPSFKGSSALSVQRSSCLRDIREQHSRFEQFEPGPAVHLALDGL